MDRNFIDVVDEMIDALPAEDIYHKKVIKSYREDLDVIRSDASITAPEILWQVRGLDITRILEKALKGIELEGAVPGWLVTQLSIFSTKPEMEVEKELYCMGYSYE